MKQKCLMLIMCSLLVTTTFAGEAPEFNNNSKSPPNVCNIEVQRTNNDILVVLNFEVLVPDNTPETKVPMVRIRKDFYEFLLWYFWNCSCSDSNVEEDEEDEEDEYLDKASLFYWYPGKIQIGSIRYNL